MRVRYFSAAELVRTAHVICTTRFDDDTEFGAEKFRGVRHMVLRHLTYFPVYEMLISFTQITDPDELAFLTRVVSGIDKFSEHIQKGVDADHKCSMALGQLSRQQYDTIVVAPQLSGPHRLVPRRTRDNYLLDLLAACQDPAIEEYAKDLACELVPGHDGTFDELLELSVLLTRVPTA